MKAIIVTDSEGHPIEVLVVSNRLASDKALDVVRVFAGGFGIDADVVPVVECASKLDIEREIRALGSAMTGSRRRGVGGKATITRRGINDTTITETIPSEAACRKAGTHMIRCTGDGYCKVCFS